MTHNETIMRNALQRIINFRPEFHDLPREQSEEMWNCPDCKRSWTHHCDKHYRVLSALTALNEQERNSQGYHMRDIAEQAIRLLK